MESHDVQVERIRKLYQKVHPALQRFCESPAPSEDWFVACCLDAEAWIRDLKAQRSAGTLPTQFSELVDRVEKLERSREEV